MKRASNWIMLGVTLCLLLFGPGSFWSATWLSKWALLMAFGSVGFCVWAASQTSLWHLPLLLYAFGSLLVLAAWPSHPYQGVVDPVTLLALQKNAFAGLGELLTLVALTAFLARRSSWALAGYYALAFVWGLGVVATLALPMAGPRSPPNNGLWFGNPSMGASLLACLLPFAWGLSVWKRHAWDSVVALGMATLWAIALTRASVPWGVFGVVCAAYAVTRLRPGRRFLSFLIVPVLALLLMAGGRQFLGADFWDSNGRAEIWGMAWAWFREHGSLSVGMGYSSSQILIPLEQVITGHYHGDYFMWLHSDWLQLLIEGGVLGMACVALSLGRLVWVSREHPQMFASLAGFIALACFNYPLRLPIHCFCLAIVCGVIECLGRYDIKTKSGGKFALKPSVDARTACLAPAEAYADLPADPVHSCS